MSDHQPQLDDYLAAIAEGDLTLEDATQLESLLLRDQKALWRYVQTVHLHSALQWRLADVSDLPKVFPGSHRLVEPCAASHGVGNRLLSNSWLAVALLVGFCAAVWTTLWLTNRPQHVRNEIEGAVPPPLMEQPAAQGARIELVSPDCEWAAEKWKLDAGSHLKPGQQVRITRGQVELAFDKGAEVVLVGPAAFIVSSANSAHLILGGLTAQVPDTASGFQVDTPHGKVVDLGTEFGLIVDDFGSTEVGVFKGKVLTHAHRSDAPVQLDAGESLLWHVNSAKRLDVRPHRFGPRTLYSGFLNDNASAEFVLVDDFEGQELNEEWWKTLGYVSQKNGKLQLGRDEGVIDRGNVPYLLSTRQLDPSDGAVVVTGTVTFSDPLRPSSGALSVFTRAEDERGEHPRPDYALLATGVRSTFWPVSTVEGETLRVLIRPLPEAHNVGILGEEFEASMESPKWRFQVVDDGVNLTLTVAQFDNSAVMKTVHARSLFHGTENFIALEGGPNATILVDDLKILQFKTKPGAGALRGN